MSYDPGRQLSGKAPGQPYPIYDGSRSRLINVLRSQGGSVMRELHRESRVAAVHFRRLEKVREVVLHRFHSGSHPSDS